MSGSVVQLGALGAQDVDLIASGPGPVPAVEDSYAAPASAPGLSVCRLVWTGIAIGAAWFVGGPGAAVALGAVLFLAFFV
jgi:hypothetical protein